ncbi:hypothetical protein [Acrocarpospora macrocephala]|nr:hypothetical protein [Acrocarpospora macrocephala]
MTEKELRTLLIRATEDRPPGIDLMPALKPRRIRVLVPSIAAIGIAAAMTAIMLVVPGNQPSAEAQVAAAIENTSKESYRIHTETGTRTFEGAFDPVNRLGIITEAGGRSETRFIGDTMYTRPQDATLWSVFSRDEATIKDAPAATMLVKLAPLDPQAALEKLRLATDVREDGPASGPDWTGQRFAFSLKDQNWPGYDTKAESNEASGTVEVDEQGRVRRLVVTFSDNGQRVAMNVDTFGTPVTVTPPPTDQINTKTDTDPTFNPKKPIDTSAPKRP